MFQRITRQLRYSAIGFPGDLESTVLIQPAFKIGKILGHEGREKNRRRSSITHHNSLARDMEQTKNKVRKTRSSEVRESKNFE